jgi:hypothetical protein
MAKSTPDSYLFHLIYVMSCGGVERVKSVSAALDDVVAQPTFQSSKPHYIYSIGAKICFS